jgi:hypothetical protein
MHPLVKVMVGAIGVKYNRHEDEQVVRPRSKPLGPLSILLESVSCLHEFISRSVSAWSFGPFSFC